ncbi:MAG: transposase [Oceanicoccus sp.]
MFVDCSGLIALDTSINDNTVNYWRCYESKRAYKNYPPAFKEEAVALVTDQGYSVAEAAESLSIRANQLYDWKKKIEATKLNSALSDDEHSVF